MERDRLRLRLLCEGSRRPLLTELLESRSLGPDESAPVALVERGQASEGPLALVFDPERLGELPALLDLLAPRRPERGYGRAPQAQSVAMRSLERIEIAPLEAVLYFVAEGQIVRCFTAEAAGEVRERLYELEDRLPPSSFMRVSKSAIANLDAVREVHPWFGRGLLLRFGREGRQVEVSRNYVGVLKDRLGL